MNFPAELIEKAKQAKRVEELQELAKAENIELSAEEAESAFNKLHRTGELSDEELDNDAGGCGDDSESEEPKKPVNKFNPGDRVYITPGMRASTVISFEYRYGTFMYDVKYDVLFNGYTGGLFEEERLEHM